MCSICGIVDFKNKLAVNANIAKEMGATLIHRGPDQQGIFVNNEVALQHNRLAIMDIERGLQPMTRTVGGKSYTIVYNGEIYNTPELRKELESKGINFETHCDTEVVLYTYIVYKDNCASKLNGIFGFVIYDEFESKVYIARDRFGIKPLFFSKVNTTFLFGSEIKSLLKHPQVSPKIDKEGMWQLLYLAPNKIAGTSVFKDIYEVKPAYHGYFKENSLTLEPYWKLEAKEFVGNREEAIETTKYLLTDAIKRQLVSDAPLATFLSGGIDSSIISSVASRHYKENNQVLNTYSFEYEGNKDNFHNTLFQPQKDDEFAVYLAKYLGTNHTILTATTNHIVNYLTDATYFKDVPGMADIDSSLLYYCREVKKAHTVSLSGECADEIFGGYPWFYREEMLSKGFFPWIHAPHKRPSLFNEDMIKPKAGFDFMQEIYLKSLKECPVLDTDTKSMRQSRIGTWLSTNYFMTSLLDRKDRMSMASGLEVRVPFADHRILEYVYNVPWEIKFEGNVEKALLRNAMADYLPDLILHRKKSPYPKTHNPQYEKCVIEILQTALQNKASLLSQLINPTEIDELIQCDNVTWFGQLMSKPQLIAWLIQLDYWFEKYNIELV
ncbi:asparagine synthase (glutamine-hydrolyzing) [Candidatus Epulonipiscium fishelsonii]|uniref:Asparagine synthase (Glutamine-hydrolyzing) n=1 Tax=Candidatus Epulonipiscium fishelsonii TaxID=77094 RepID=A0ACC8X8Y6_9FIRM|nr:asparagine synthase (glutamine-hydrolyzing) [Epulopiscium sp. SCG-B11WGA-EpuloA1]ONI38738.1 asparagine synthase (glutamine-hydrolyzing) [Epulopiscium sp. SCG-B05WGA-EpuloA1]